MTLKSEQAMAALFDALSQAAGLPTPIRNEVRLHEFEPTDTDGVGRRLILNDGDIETDEEEVGDGGEFELWVKAEIRFGVDGETGPERDAVFAAGMQALAAALWPDGVALTVEGVIEDMRVSGNVERIHQLPEGGRPLEVAIVSLALLITAPTPLG